MDTDEKIRNQEENKKPETNKPDKSKTVKVIIYIVLVLLVGGVLYGVYYWQHKKVNSQATEISSLKSQISDAAKQLASTQSTTSESEAKEGSTTDELVSAAAEAYCEAALNPTTKKALVFTQGKAGPQQKAILYSTDKKFAYINARCDDGGAVEGGGSAAYYLKFVNDSWIVLYRGQSSDPKLDVLYGVPASFN